MTGLADLLAGRIPAGVHRWRSPMPVEEVARTVGSSGWGFAHLDGSRISFREEFLTGAGTALGFPETYGANFDALADLLDDVGATVLLWDGWEGFAGADERWFAVALEIFTVRALAEGLPPFVVLLREAEGSGQVASEDALGRGLGE